MLIPFIKMHAQGNDFIILDFFAMGMRDISFPAFAEQVCTPHTGIGADGLVLMSPCENADGQMIVYNSDGSRAEMCGSALRCVAYLLHNKLSKNELGIQTDSGIKTATVSADGSVCVNLGLPRLLKQEYLARGFRGDLIDIGNQHYIIWQSKLESDPHLLHGAMLEHYHGFEQAVNVHFATVINPAEVRIKIWEHACGATLACGTGAASTVFSGVQRGLLQGSVTVNMPGGAVQIEPLESGYLLCGEVTVSFSGDYHWKT